MGETTSKTAPTREETPAQAQIQALAQISSLLGSREALEALCHDLFDRECVNDGGGVSRAGLRTLTRLVVDSCHVSDPAALQELLDVLAPLPSNSSNGEDGGADDGPRLGYEGFICYARCVLRVVDAALQAEVLAQKKDASNGHSRSPSFDGKAGGYLNGSLAAVSEESICTSPGAAAGPKELAAGEELQMQDVPIWPCAVAAAPSTQAAPSTPACKQPLEASPLEPLLSPLATARNPLSKSPDAGSEHGKAGAAEVTNGFDQQPATSSFTSPARRMRFAAGGLVTAADSGGSAVASTGATASECKGYAAVTAAEQLLKCYTMSNLLPCPMPGSVTAGVTPAMTIASGGVAASGTGSVTSDAAGSGTTEDPLVTGRKGSLTVPGAPPPVVWGPPLLAESGVVRARSESPITALASGPHRLAGRAMTTVPRRALTPPPSTAHSHVKAFIPRASQGPAPWMHSIEALAARAPPSAVLSAGSMAPLPTVRSVSPRLATPRRAMRMSMPAFGNASNDEAKEMDLPVLRSPMRAARSCEPRECSREVSLRGSVGDGASVLVAAGADGTSRSTSPLATARIGRVMAPPEVVGSSLVTRSPSAALLGTTLDPASSNSVWRFSSSVASSSNMKSFVAPAPSGSMRSFVAPAPVSPVSTSGSTAAPALGHGSASVPVPTQASTALPTVSLPGSGGLPVWPNRVGSSTPDFHDSASPVPQPLRGQQASMLSGRSSPPTRTVSPRPLLPPPRISGGGGAVVRGFHGSMWAPHVSSNTGLVVAKLADEHAADSGGAAAALNAAVRRSSAQKPVGNGLQSSASVGSFCMERARSGPLRRSCSPNRLATGPPAVVGASVKVPAMVAPALLPSAFGSSSTPPASSMLAGLLQSASVRNLGSQGRVPLPGSAEESAAGLAAAATDLNTALVTHRAAASDAAAEKREQSCEGQLKPPMGPQVEAPTLSWPCTDGADFNRSRHVRFEEPTNSVTSSNFASPSLGTALQIQDARFSTGPVGVSLQNEAIVSLTMPSSSPTLVSADNTHNSTPLSCLVASPPALITPSPPAQEMGKEAKGQGVEQRISAMPVFSPPRLCTPSPANGPSQMLCTPVRDMQQHTPTMESNRAAGEEGPPNALASNAGCSGTSVADGATAVREPDTCSQSLGIVHERGSKSCQGTANRGRESPERVVGDRMASPLLNGGNECRVGRESPERVVGDRPLLGSDSKLPRDVPEILRHHLEVMSTDEPQSE